MAYPAPAPQPLRYLRLPVFSVHTAHCDPWHGYRLPPTRTTGGWQPRASSARAARAARKRVPRAVHRGVKRSRDQSVQHCTPSTVLVTLRESRSGRRRDSVPQRLSCMVYAPPARFVHRALLNLAEVDRRSTRARVVPTPRFRASFARAPGAGRLPPPLSSVPRLTSTAVGFCKPTAAAGRY